MDLILIIYLKLIILILYNYNEYEMCILQFKENEFNL